MRAVQSAPATRGAPRSKFILTATETAAAGCRRRRASLAVAAAAIPWQQSAPQEPKSPRAARGWCVSGQRVNGQ